MPDFAVRVRGAKGRSWRSPRRLVAVYLGLWVFALVVFLLMDPTDAMGYALLFHWLLLPIAAFVISLRIGELVRRDGRMWLLPLALGLLYMLADFLTFCLSGTCFSSGRPSLPWAFSSGDCWAAGDPNLPD